MSTKSYKEWNSKETEISLKEFDALKEKHEFSNGYMEEKEAMLSALKNHEQNKAKRVIGQIAAAIAIVMVLIPASSFAAEKFKLMDIVDNVFGNSTKGNVAKVNMQLEEKQELIDVILPSMEYVPVDETVAKKYLPEELVNLPIEADLGNEHKITIYDFTYNKYGGALSYTIERKGGITMLFYDEYTNQAKGFGFNEDAIATYKITAGKNVMTSEKKYINSEKSTNDKVDCYEYFMFSRPLKEGEIVTFRVEPYDTSEYSDLDKTIPLSEDLKMSEAEATFVCTDTYVPNQEATLSVTPINMYIDLLKGFGYSEDSESFDGYLISGFEINYKDGTSYVIQDRNQNIDNAGYAIAGIGQDIKREEGMIGTHYGIAFNRIIDLDQIESIKVGSLEFHLKK